MLNRRLAGLIMAAFLILASGCAQKKVVEEPKRPEPVSTANLPNGLVVHEFRLANGMRVLIVPNRQAPVFNYQLWVHTGSVQEVLDPKLKRAGLAHLFEHMMFRGTPKYPADQYDRLLTEAGVNGLNASTWYDRTNYYFSLPKDRLDFALEIEADRFQNLALNKDLFTKEIGAVLGELKMFKDRPGSVASEKLMSLIFERHPYGVEVIGLEQDLKNYTVEEAQYFFRTYYTPNNFTLLLVGDVEVDKALASVESTFGKMEARPFPEGQAEPEPEQQQKREVSITHHAAQNESIRWGFRTVPATNLESAALEVLGAALGQGQGAIFQREIVDAGLASYAGANSSAYRQDGVFQISVEIRPGVKRKTVEDKVSATLERVSSQLLKPEEIERARNIVLLSLYDEINTNSGLAEVLAEGLLLGDSYLYFFNFIDHIKQVTSSDVQAVARKYLSPARSSVVFMKPGKAADKAKQAAVKQGRGEG